MTLPGLKGVALALALSLNIFTPASASYPACEDDITCFSLTPSDKPDLTFDCAYVNASGTSGPVGFVYHMHGNDGLQSKAMFFETMRQLAPYGFTSLACDARGYSPNAAPYDYDSYHYDKLQSDIFSIVDESGLSEPFGDKFHVVAHDQGARVAWHSIAVGAGRKRYLSLSSLSIPHADVFSNSLLSDSPDLDQQEASQYVRELVLPNSTTFYQSNIYSKVCVPNGFSSAEDCQKTLWWYNGAIDAGNMALAPMMDYTDGSVSDWLGIPQALVEATTQYPLEGVAQSALVGNVTEFPVFYGCGSQDTSDLCKQAFSDESEALIERYSYIRVDACGHNVLGCSLAQAYIDKVIENIQSAYDE